MKKLLSILTGITFVLLGNVALADSAVLSWINATQNTDSSAIPAPPAAGSLTRTTIEYGTCNAAHTAIVGTVGTMFVAPPATTLTVSMVVVQEYCFDAFHTNTFSVNSAKTLVVWKANPPPTPGAPGSLTVMAAAPMAYGIGQSKNRLTLFAVGPVPADTPCDKIMEVNGMHQVPFELVDWQTSARPPVVVAQCSAS